MADHHFIHFYDHAGSTKLQLASGMLSLRLCTESIAQNRDIVFHRLVVGTRQGLDRSGRDTQAETFSDEDEESDFPDLLPSKRSVLCATHSHLTLVVVEPGDRTVCLLQQRLFIATARTAFVQEAMAEDKPEDFLHASEGVVVQRETKHE